MNISAQRSEKDKGMRTLCFALMAGSMFLLALGGCGSGGEGEPPETAIPVRTAQVLLEETAPPVHTSGRLSSVLEARLSFKVGGIIRAMNFAEGEAVRKGDVLAELMLDEISAQAQQARSGYEKAQRDYARAQNLYADSVIALERLQDAETGLAVARSTMEIAEFNLHHSSIRAPAAGRVLKRYAEVNELVAPGQPIILFGAAGEEWILRAAVNDRELIRLRIGDPARVAFDAYPDIEFTARLSEVAEAADPMSGSYEVELVVEPNGNRLISGFVADIDIFPTTGGEHRVIPIGALVEADGSLGVVYTVDRENKRARVVHIVIDHMVNGRVAVSSGLENVTEVVTDGAAYLADSSLVSIAE
jgi:RND family efflux transporter MFP subunit